MVYFIFSDTAEFGIAAKSKVHHPSHSCEGRNLRAERRKLSPKAFTISRRFAAAEIPAFAGMGRVGEARIAEIAVSPSAKEIPAFAGMVYFIFSDTAEFGIVRKDKKYRHSGESRNLFNPIPANAGISFAEGGRKKIAPDEIFFTFGEKKLHFWRILVVYYASEGVGAAIWEIGVYGVFYSKRGFFMKNFIFSLSRPLWAVYGAFNAIPAPVQGGGGGDV
ncbi:MAG: hypothetical protein ACR2QC_11065 [Gammaproteobacteria bacterium]